MPLANILKKPTDEQLSVWEFNHQQDHREIVEATNRLHGSKLPIYPIWPRTDGDHDNWARLHQQFHTDMARVLGIQQSDLTAPSASALDTQWYWRNYWEHAAARKKLGI